MTAGAREALKWLALILMVGDHVNAGLLGRSVPWFYDLGRIVMPTFAAVLAYNLAGPGNVENGRYRRSMVRLLMVGAIAYPFHVWVLGQGWLVANILIGYALAIMGMYLVDRWGQRGAIAAAFLIVVGGGFVEFYWAASSGLAGVPGAAGELCGAVRVQRQRLGVGGASAGPGGPWDEVEVAAASLGLLRLLSCAPGCVGLPG